MKPVVDDHTVPLWISYYLRYNPKYFDDNLQAVRERSYSTFICPQGVDAPLDKENGERSDSSSKRKTSKKKGKKSSKPRRKDGNQEHDDNDEEHFSGTPQERLDRVKEKLEEQKKEMQVRQFSVLTT